MTCQKLMVPKKSPDTKSVSSCGCIETAVTSFFWLPVGAGQFHVMSDSLVRRKSYSLSFWSALPVTNELPLFVHAQQRTVFLWPWMVSRHLAVSL